MFCPNCGVENPDSAAECRRCHVPFHDEAHAEVAAPEANAAGTICTRCETFNEPGVERCTTCGNPLHAGAGHDAPPMDATPAEPHPAHEPLADPVTGAHHEAPAEEVHPHDDPGSTHALAPVSASDTPAEGSPSIADELSALELSPEDARAARGEDATPPDGSAPVPPQTAEHKIDLSAMADEEESTSVAANPFDDEHEEHTNVSKNPFEGEEPTSAAHAEPSLDHTPPAPMRIAPAARKAAPPASPPPPPVPTPAPTPAPPPAAAAPPPAAPAAEKICASCASVNLPNAKFCAECGTPFPKKPAVMSAPPPPPPAPVSAPPPAVQELEHTPPQPHRAEPLHAEEALQHNPTPAEAQRIPISEDANESHHAAEEHAAHFDAAPVAQHESAALEEAPAHGDFDPTRTDQAKAAPAAEAEPVAEAEHTSEQPRLELPEEHGGEHFEAAPAAAASAHHDSPEEGLSVSIESMESLHADAGAVEEAPPADATPAEPYAVGAEGEAHAEDHPLPEEQPLEESSDLAAQVDALPEELAEPAPPGDEAPPEGDLPHGEPAEHAPPEEPAFAEGEADGHDPLAAASEEHPQEQAHEEPPHEEQAHEEALAEETPAEEQPLEETPAEEPLAEEQAVEEAPAEEPLAEEQPIEEVSAEEPLAEEPPVEEAPAEEPLAEEQPAEDPLAAGEAETTFEHEAAAAEAEPAPEPIPAPYAVQLIVEQGAQAGVSFQLPYLENSVGSAGASIELGEDMHLAPHHATVIFDEQRLLLRDEGAVNGVFLKLRLAGALEPGDQFIAGQRLFRFDGPVELAASEGTPPFQGAPRPAGTPVRIVELLSGGKQGRTCHRAGPVIAVGKTGCDLNFGSDTLLASRHAEIHLAEDGTASLLDLGNAESGVLMRVRSGTSVELQAGDVLQLGAQVVRIETEQPA